MARRYQLAAEKEEDLVEAEKYTKKAVEYYEEWSRSWQRGMENAS